MPRRPANELDVFRPDDEKRRTRPVEHLIADVLDAEDRVISGQRIRVLGLTKDEVHGRVKRGSLHRKQRGVYTAGNPALTLQGEWRAAVEAVGPDAFLDAGTACALWGFRESSEGEVVRVVCRRNVRDRPGVKVGWQPDLPEADTSLCRGVRVVMPARALLGYAACERSHPRLRRAVNQALVDRRVSVAGLVELIARSRGRRGVARLARVLDESSPTRSELEDVIVAALCGYGAQFETNARVEGCEVDVLFRAAGLVVECDSRYHDNPVARARDAAKDARLRAADLHVERVRMRDLTVDLHRTVPRLLALVDHRVQRSSS